MTKATNPTRLMLLFEGHSSISGTHGVPDLDPNGVKWGIKKTAKTLPVTPTPDLWKQHLDGKRPLGIIPIREDSLCCWGSIDIDKYDINLLGVVAQVEQLKLPLVACRSKSGGLHLFLFMSAPVPAVTVQSALRNMAEKLGFAGSEIFPKQTSITDADSGNWMVMPYFGGTYDGKLKLQYGLKKTGAEMTLEEFVGFAEKRRIDAAKLAQHNSPAPQKAKAATRAVLPSADGPFSDGPPCLQTLAVSGFPDGGRNNALFHIGVYLKKAKADQWEQMLSEDNQKYMKPPLPDDEVETVVKSLKKKAYEYKCKDQPMESHCQSKVCCSRMYGVGDGKKIPVIVGWSKVLLEEPVHHITINGSNKVMKIKNFKEIYRHNLFVEHCGGQLNLIFPPLSPWIWAKLLDEYSQLIAEVEPSEDQTAFGQFKEILETFVTNRSRAQSKEDILRGAPWEDEDKGRHYFRLQDLQKVLEQQRMRTTRNEVTEWIRLLGGPKDCVETTIKSTSVRLWWVPTSAVQRAPELAPPAMPKESI